ncbi:hypothetical protein O3M35_004784 [Rhynocoris fuscipes]|uniref:Uncharacterized protein n=1 Tax=Rhynocoris fuscipes TaxID=488301 RepID=A0AAW1DG55_9HEMI
MTSLNTYLIIKFLSGHHMLYHVIHCLKGHNSETNENSTLLLGIVGKLSKSTF